MMAHGLEMDEIVSLLRTNWDTISCIEMLILR